MINSDPNSRMPGSFLSAHFMACMTLGFDQEAERVGLCPSMQQDWGSLQFHIRDTMLRAAKRFGVRYDAEHDPEKATVSMSTDEFYDVITEVGKKIAATFKNDKTIMGEHQVVGYFHELMQAYRNKE